MTTVNRTFRSNADYLASIAERTAAGWQDPVQPSEDPRWEWIAKHIGCWQRGLEETIEDFHGILNERAMEVAEEEWDDYLRARNYD